MFLFGCVCVWMCVKTLRRMFNVIKFAGEYDLNIYAICTLQFRLKHCHASHILQIC